MARSDREHLNRVARSARLSRRWFLGAVGAMSHVALTGAQGIAGRPHRFSKDPFTLGVASGDPDHESVVLWTRLAEEPMQPGGGMPPEPLRVDWEIALDDSFRQVVQTGTTTARPQLGHSVHVEVQGLRPDHWYWFRFRSGDAESPIGRTRTMPAPETLPDHVRFAVTSCQNYEQGLFTAYGQMIQDDVDLVFHLGDYIYEYAGYDGRVRKHFGNEIASLDDYRIRHSQYRLDPLLHNMHAHCPWIVTWDDHEFDNNWAGGVSEEPDVDPVEFLARRVNAFQAYYEMMPLRSSCMPTGPDMRLYRQVSYGRLADFQVLDTRQYRTDQPNGDRKSPLNDAALDRQQSMLGREQRGWMYRNLISSSATWNVLAQQVMMGMVNRTGTPDLKLYSMDQWPGYAFDRMQLMNFLGTRKVSNPVVLTGDIHSNWANELRVDDRREDQQPVATEFVATSLSSGGNGTEKPKGLSGLLAANQCVKYHNAERGYLLCNVTPEEWKTDYMVVDDVEKPGGKTFSRATLTVEEGRAELL